jgi:hypothetical protein
VGPARRYLTRLTGGAPCWAQRGGGLGNSTGRTTACLFARQSGLWRWGAQRTLPADPQRLDRRILVGIGHQVERALLGDTYEQKRELKEQRVRLQALNASTRLLRLWLLSRVAGCTTNGCYDFARCVVKANRGPEFLWYCQSKEAAVRRGP